MDSAFMQYRLLRSIFIEGVLYTEGSYIELPAVPYDLEQMLQAQPEQPPAPTPAPPPPANDIKHRRRK
jgi:hypothetical protein